MCCCYKYRGVSVAEFYAPRYGTVDGDPSLPEQKLSINWVYPFKPRQRENLTTAICQTSYFINVCDNKMMMVMR